MYCINYALNSGSYRKIAETLLHDRKFLVVGGGGVELLKTIKPSDP